MTATDIVPADNIAALDTLDAESREVAITGMLDQARSWLAHAVESTAPAQSIADFKAYIATAAETAKRLRVSKEIQQDAEVMVRRSERALGQAVRSGQQRGEIAARGEHGFLGNQHARPAESSDATRTSPSEFFAHGVERGQVYEMTDNVTDDEFDEALGRAQDEGNVSRANVVRKVREVQSGAERQAEKWGRVAALAQQGYSSRQIASEVGMSEEGLRSGARREGIAFPADKAIGRTRRLDTNRVIREAAIQLEGVVMGLELINPADIDPEEAQAWVDSLTRSIKALSKARNTIKESIS